MKNLISIEALEVQGLEFSGIDGVLKMLRGSMVVLKGVKCNNLYHLKDNIVTGQLVTSVGIDDSTGLWHMRLGRTGEKTLQALEK